MQQVFGMCSMLLQRNTDTRKRKLNIRRYKVLQVAVGCGRRPGLLILSLSPGGALLSEQRCVGVVLWDGAHWPVPGGPREGSPQALQTAGLDQPELPQEDDGALAARPASWGGGGGVLTSALARRRLLLASTRSSRPTARCVATSGPSSGTSAWSASWTRRCGWRNGWPTPAAWPPPP